LTPPYIKFIFKNNINFKNITKKVDQKLKFPVVLKPINEGSSVGVYITNKNNFILFFLSSYSDVNSLVISLSTSTNKILLLIFFIISMLHIRIQLGKVYEDYFQLNKMKLYSLITDGIIGISFLFFLPVLFI